jgi:tellurite resistance protein TehA-like permease
MRKSTRIVIGFAVVGFILPLLLLAFYAFADQFGKHPNTTPLLYLCPSSIMSMALSMDGPRPLLEGIVVWLMICVSNALLYAGPVLAVVVIYRVIRPDTQPSGLRLR